MVTKANSGEKALTISVAAYNVGKTIERCLDSCIVPDLLDDLEVIVVNDGSTDETLKIVKGYEERYPNTFKVIDKPNEGYGTTVNASMAIATGRYFRLLDGDDWLDQEGLQALIEYCRTGDADWIFTNRVLEYPTKQVVETYKKNIPIGERIVSQETMGCLKPCMWMSTFKTDIFKKHPFELPKYYLYTDILFVANCISHVASTICLEKPLYHYVIDHSDSQSTSVGFIAKHLNDNYVIWDSVLRISRENFGDNPSPLMCYRLLMSYYAAYSRTVMQKRSNDRKAKLIELERDLKETNLELYKYMGRHSRLIRVMRITHGTAYGLIKRIGKYKD